MIQRTWRPAVAFVTMLLLTLPAAAEVVKDLYLGQVPVATRGEAQLAEAARQALSQVYVKVSGSAEVLSLPSVAASLDGALDQAQQFSYARNNDPEFPLLARFEFDGGWVTGVLKQAGAPLWTANRPAVLVWLVEEVDGVPQFVSSDSAPEVLDALRADFDRRGVPLRYPLYDLADTSALSPQQVWRFSEAPLELASRRYQAQDILAGRLVRELSGDWSGQWFFRSSYDHKQRDAGPGSLGSVLQVAASLVAEDMAARYALSAGGTTAERGVAITVTNVRSYADYAAVLTWLQQLELVDAAEVEGVAGDRLQLRLKTRLAPEQLATIFELNRRLIPDNYVASDGELRYQWQN